MASSNDGRLVNLLLVISLICLSPLAFAMTAFNYAAVILTPQNRLRRKLRRTPRFKPKTVVITGISTAPGLRTARALWQTGHTVIGADIHTSLLFNPARFSRAVKKIYKLRPPHGNHGSLDYVQDLVQVVEKEKAELWIDCTTSVTSETIAQSKQLIGRRTACQCIAADAVTLTHFKTPRELHSFARSRGLPSPEFHMVKSRNEIHAVLNQRHGAKRYLLQAPDGSNATNRRTSLPRRSLSQTYQDVSQIKIATPMRLEEDIEDNPKYQICAIVTQGKLRAFAVSAESEIGYKSLPAASGISRAMAHFVDSLAGELGHNFSSHISIRFCVDEKITHSGLVQQILPLDGRLAVSPEMLLFTSKEDSINLAHAYLSSLLTPTANGSISKNGVSAQENQLFAHPITNSRGVFSFEEDMVRLVLGPMVELFMLRCSLRSLLQSWISFLEHVLLWQEAFYAFWDPVPLFWRHFVSAPLQHILGN